MSAIERAETTPRRVGRWLLERRLGAGGFGTAWAARDPSGRVVVVKLLSEPPGDEIRALAKIHHPAVVEALGAGTEPVPHLVMAYAPGVPLSQQTTAVDASVGLRIVAVLADALAACHAAGVAHGDIKPANLMFEPRSGQLTVIDFGGAGGGAGTPRYAAPERPGASPSAEADVYALGLIAWELFTRRLPWPDDAFDARFEPDVPRLPTGPEWLGDLLLEILQPDPSLRPTAAAIADACEANGVPLGTQTPAAVARRAQAVWVPSPGVATAVSEWLARGGALALTGPTGAGLSHTLAAVANELQARGQPFLTIGGGGAPWSGIEAALGDPSLPGPPCVLPRAADQLTLAEDAAEALITRADPTQQDPRRLFVLVDAWDELDEGSQATLEVLRRAQAALLFTARRPPPEVRQLALGPLDPGRTTQLLTGILGPVDPAVVRSAIRVCGGLPRAIVDYAVAAVSRQALVWRRRSWVLDPGRLEHLESTWVHGSLPSTGSLPGAARVLGALIALAQPLERGEALQVAAASERDLDALIGVGLVRGGAHLQCSGPAATAALREVGVDLRAMSRDLATRWLLQQPVPWARLGPVLAETQDPAMIQRHGARCVSSLAERDVALAAELAAALWATAPCPAIAEARTRVLVRAGRVDEAREEGRALLQGHEPGPDDVPILIALAAAEGVAHDPEARIHWIEAAVAVSEPTLSDALRLARAQARFSAEELAEAEEDCLAVCATPPHGDRIGVWLSAIRLLAQIRARREGAAAGLAVLDEVPEGLGAQTAERALVEGTRGRLLWHAGRARAAATAMEATATFRRALPLVDRARLENNAGLCWYSVGDVVKAVECWERALLSFERIGAPLDAVSSRVNLCQGYRDLGRWQRAEATGLEAIASAREQGIATLEAMALGNLGDVALWQRKLARAEARYTQAEQVAIRADALGEQIELARRRAELAALRWDPDVDARLERAQSLALEHDAREEVGRCLAIRALVCAREGREDEARDTIEVSLRVLREIGASGELAIARLWACEAWLALRRPAEATTEAEAVLRYAEEFVRLPLKRWAEQVLERSRPKRAASDVERLTQVAVRIAMHQGLTEIFDDLAAAAVELVGADRALVVLLEDGEARIAAQAGQQPKAPPSMSIVERVLSTGREVVARDLEERADLRENQSVVAMNLRAAVCMPLIVDEVPLGALYLDSQGQPGGDLREAATLVRALAAHASVALHNARLTTEIRKRAEDAEGAHRFAAALLRAVPTPVVVAAADGTTTDANDAAIALFGGEEGLPEHLGTLLDPLEGGLQDEHLLQLPHRRRAIPVHVNEAAIHTPDGHLRRLCALTDLTPRIAAEVQQAQAIAAAREANEAKDRFLATMSHELRTPLNAIIGYSELILELAEDGEIVADLHRILSAGQHLLGLIDDVLDISRIEAGRLGLTLDNEPLDEVFAEVIALTRPAVLDSGARFEISIPDDPGRALTDHRRVRQVCTNLLTNAIQHAGATTIALIVHTSNAQIVVEVCDDGIGLQPAQLETLFQPFVQHAPAQSSGAGLGLAIAHRLAAQLGGHLEALSEPGRGSTFRFVFPRHLSDHRSGLSD